MDKETLYNAEVKLLTSYCRNCLDSHMKDVLAMFLFKMTLLENAEELGLPEDVEKYYADILSLLGICPCRVIGQNYDCSEPPKGNTWNKCSKFKAITGNTGTNGYCSLCK